MQDYSYERLDAIIYSASSSKPIEELKEFCSRTMIVAKNETRPWGEFGEEFSLPNPQVVKKRLFTNLIYYKVNYAIISAAIITFISLFWSFQLFIVTKVAMSLAFYLFHSRKPVIVFGKTLDRNTKIAIFLTFTLAASYFFSALTALTISVGVCVSTVSIHALSRPRSNKSKFKTMGMNADLGQNVKKEIPVVDASLNNAVERQLRQSRNASYLERRRKVLTTKNVPQINQPKDDDEEERKESSDDHESSKKTRMNIHVPVVHNVKKIA